MTEILLIDNHDSFTHLLADLITHASGIVPRIVRNNAPATELRLTDADLIVLSPGPGRPTPEELGASAEALTQDQIPVFGVCLGHQAIAHLAGAQLRRAPFPMHGQTSRVSHTGDPLFDGIPSTFEVVRYHSLDVTAHPDIDVLARADDGTIMALKHKSKPQWGVQFHPESIGTEYGLRLVRNVLISAGVAKQWRRSEIAAIDPADACAGLQAAGYQYLTWLDSADGSGMSIVAAGNALCDFDSIPLGLLSHDSIELEHGFVPGALGVLSYEASNGHDGAPITEQLMVPDVAYQFVDGAVYLLEHSAPPTRNLPVVRPQAAQAPGTPIKLRHSRASYVDLVQRCQEFIASGDSYELCLTTSASADCAADPLELYLRLRAVSPSPMAGLYLCPDYAVLSASPERFLRVRDGQAKASPIKGTRPRGETAAEDDCLVAELAESAKDGAENIMIVDLLRNDLSRTCSDINVPELCRVHTFTHAHQLISSISGRLRAGVTATEVIQAAFPGGSMTGAPKQSSMDILRDLEARPRGTYSGIMGYVSATGDADFSILIRCLHLAGGQATYGAGGAITALSDPDAEFDEVLAKLRPFTALWGVDVAGH